MSSDVAPVKAPFGLRYRAGLGTGRYDVASSLTADGRVFATAHAGMVDRWDWETSTGRLIAREPGPPITALAISPDGMTVAVAAGGRILIWDWDGSETASFPTETAEVTALSWSPDGMKLASMSADQVVKLWCVPSWNLFELGRANDWGLLYTLGAEKANSFGRVGRGRLGDHEFTAITWARDGGDHYVALRDGSVLQVGFEFDINCLETFLYREKTYIGGQINIEINDAKKRKLNIEYTISDDNNTSLCLVSGRYPLAAAYSDGAVRLWGLDRAMGGVFEGHTGPVTFLAPCGEGRLLVSGADDGTVRVWRVRDGATLAVLKHGCPGARVIGVRGGTLAYLDPARDVVHVWEIDEEALLDATVGDSVRYRNAKVVLVGDSGKGKSGLGLVLTGQEWAPTESTHGRHVWTFKAEDVALPEGVREKREALLWDLAGQPTYRLVHQLHLNEVVVALVVFDASSDVDPLAGVRYWDRALTQARRLGPKNAPPLRKFLVVARCDRGGVALSAERLNELARELGYDGVFKTSAKEGWEIPELTRAALGAIDWDVLPWVGSNRLFEDLKTFLVAEKEAAQLLATADDLFRTFLHAHPDWRGEWRLREAFDTCISRVEQRGLIRRLRFGGYLLLQPEMLDAYASSMINAAREEPDGLGCLTLDDSLAGRFAMPESERVRDPEQERLLLIATVEELLGFELALKEVAGDQVFLVFPSQFTRERPDAPDLPGQSVVFTFDGPAMNAYATLAVRLAHSQLFVKEAMWRNVATYRATVGGVCGIALRELEEGDGILTVFFDKDSAETTRYQFEDYVGEHLKRRVRAQALVRRRIFVCGGCGTEVTGQQARLRRERGFTTLTCPVCEVSVSLLDREERLASSAVALARVKVASMDDAADRERDRATAALVLKGKEASEDFDVFLSHNGRDKPAVRAIAGYLRERGLLPWFDEQNLRPGGDWLDEIERVIPKVKAASIIVGPNGFSDWLSEERKAFERESKRRELPVIPVILPDVAGQPKLPPFLEGKTWVDFRKLESRPVDRLVWGITGKNDSPFEAEPTPSASSRGRAGRSGWLDWLRRRGR